MTSHKGNGPVGMSRHTHGISREDELCNRRCITSQSKNRARVSRAAGVCDVTRNHLCKSVTVTKTINGGRNLVATQTRDTLACSTHPRTFKQTNKQ